MSALPRTLLAVCDNGVGLPAGVNRAQPSSLGLHLVKLLAR